MSDTTGQERRSLDVSPRGKLLRMLQSMSRRFPRTYLTGTSGGFGVRLEDGSFLQVVYNGHWSDDNMRDFLALFATWLVADPDTLRRPGIPLDGLSAQGSAESRRLNTSSVSTLRQG